MRSHHLLVRALLTAAAVASNRPAAAVNPLEYPDNGATAFSRGGAWLATATDPIAAHYNPAALATQSSGFDINLNASFQKVCFDRRNPGNALTGPQQESNDTPGVLVYLPACNERRGFPKTVPSLGVALRMSRRWALGFAFVPPSAYTDAAGAWPEFQAGFNTRTGRKTAVPAPYRYLQTENHSLIFLPTFSLGVEVFPNFRVGAGFIWGIGVIDITKFDVTRTAASHVGDHATADDVRAELKTQDFFMPGVVLSAHWSILDHLDIGAWARWVDSVRTTDADLEIRANYFGSSGKNPVCGRAETNCGQKAVVNEFGNDEFEKFQFAVIPPELRVGIRFHLPRARTKVAAQPGAERPNRDPLHDDVFDVELDSSYTQSSEADVAQVRLRGSPSGEAVVPFEPIGFLPPNADRRNGYRNTFGARLGGQYNVVRDKLAALAGSWIESQAAPDAYLHISPVPALRGGVGGGLIVRQSPVDFVVGYQRHWSQQMDNGGRGAARANAGIATDTTFRVGQAPEDRQFRTGQAVNGGRVSQSAHVFTLGAVWRF